MSTGENLPANVPANAGVPSNAVEELNTLALSKPDFLQGQQATGTDLLRKYVIPPRLRVVQPLSKAPLKPPFADGDLVAMPALQLIDKLNGTGIIFTPIFFWPEWITTNPRNLPQLPFIRERSVDPKSDIAVKSRNQATRSEPCPEDMTKKESINHIEVLNYIVVLQSASPIGREPVLLSFSKSEHKAGMVLNSLVKMRNAPIFGCQFQAKVVQRSNNKGTWFGLDVSNPPENVGPWVKSQELFNEYGAAHLMFKESYDNQILVAEYDDENEAGTTLNPEMT